MLQLNLLLERPALRLGQPGHVLNRWRHANSKKVKAWYQTLGVSEDCDEETLRLAFVHLAKKFHPDSGTGEANAVRFSEIESAYRQIRKHRIEQKECGEVEEFDIKHTAPQHRHYLAYDFGIGTVSERQRREKIERARMAAENVMEHRLKRFQAEERNTLVGKDKERARDVKTRYGMDRLVEDLIQEAMNRGEFSDLRGMGKPLDVAPRNPYVDFVTYKLNEVLIENGFTPEWIQLSKEIREDTEKLRKDLLKARNSVGRLPLSRTEETKWKNAVDGQRDAAKRINSKIDKYNLLVPIMQKQMLHVELGKLAEEALSREPDERKVNVSRKVQDTGSGEDFLSLLVSLLSKKSWQ